MSFSILIIISILIYLMLRTYRSITSAATSILFLFGSITLIFIYGLKKFSINPDSMFLGHIPEKGFYHLLAGLYLFSIISAVKIIRSYLNYKNINRK